MLNNKHVNISSKANIFPFSFLVHIATHEWRGRWGVAKIRKRGGSFTQIRIVTFFWGKNRKAKKTTLVCTSPTRSESDVLGAMLEPLQSHPMCAAAAPDASLPPHPPLTNMIRRTWQRVRDRPAMAAAQRIRRWSWRQMQVVGGEYCLRAGLITPFVAGYGPMSRVHHFAVYRPVYRDFGGYRAGSVAKPVGIPLANRTC
jgi:hypothetical protein